jgi:transcriptional regulator with XRE-family HTH domain
MAKTIINDRIFNNLQKIMDDNNISGKALAMSSGLSSSEISNIKNGKRIPTLFAMYQICKALNLDMEDVFETNWRNVNFM